MAIKTVCKEMTGVTDIDRYIFSFLGEGDLLPCREVSRYCKDQVDGVIGRVCKRVFRCYLEQGIIKGKDDKLNFEDYRRLVNFRHELVRYNLDRCREVNICGAPDSPHRDRLDARHWRNKREYCADSFVYYLETEQKVVVERLDGTTYEFNSPVVPERIFVSGFTVFLINTVVDTKRGSSFGRYPTYQSISLCDCRNGSKFAKIKLDGCLTDLWLSNGHLIVVHGDTSEDPDRVFDKDDGVLSSISPFGEEKELYRWSRKDWGEAWCYERKDILDEKSFCIALKKRMGSTESVITFRNNDIHLIFDPRHLHSYDHWNKEHNSKCFGYLPNGTFWALVKADQSLGATNPDGSQASVWEIPIEGHISAACTFRNGVLVYASSAELATLTLYTKNGTIAQSRILRQQRSSSNPVHDICVLGNKVLFHRIKDLEVSGVDMMQGPNGKAMDFKRCSNHLCHGKIRSPFRGAYAVAMQDYNTPADYSLTPADFLLFMSRNQLATVTDSIVEDLMKSFDYNVKAEFLWEFQCVVYESWQQSDEFSKLRDEEKSAINKLAHYLPSRRLYPLREEQKTSSEARNAEISDELARIVKGLPEQWPSLPDFIPSYLITQAIHNYLQFPGVVETLNKPVAQFANVTTLK